MSRALRIEFDGALYHVMSRGSGRMRVFVDDDDREAFLENVGSVVTEGGWTIHAFCIMPNHYHLLCETPHGGLSQWMRQLNSGYAQHFNRKHRRVGPLWQGRYKAILVEDGSFFLECSRYIHLNPNLSKLTRPAERYKWSSYHSFIGRRVSPVDWVSTERTLSHFSGDRKAYRDFVKAGQGKRLISPFERAVAGLVFGGDAFVKEIRHLTRSLEENRDQPALKELRRMAKADPDEVEKLVEKIFPREHPRRRVRLLLYGLRKHSRLRPTEIANRHGRSPAAVTLAVTDLDKEAQDNEVLRKKFKRLANAVKKLASRFK